MKCAVFLLSCIVTGLVVGTSCEHGLKCHKTPKTIHDAVGCIKFDYDKVQKPNETGKALRVSIDLVVITIGRLDDIEMDYSLEFYLRQRWKEPLLRFDNRTLPENSSYAVLDHALIDRLWTPDTYAENMKTMEVKPSHGAFINRGLRLFPDGTILLSSRISATLACRMQFRSFPMDTQNCPITLSSYFHTEADLYFTWGEVYMYDQVKSNNQFDILGVESSRSSLQFSSGTFSSLDAVFKFRRRVQKFMLGFYIPSILTVMLSWVSFYISPYSAPARCALGTITVLAVGGFLTGQRRSFPVVPYFMAADLYILVCYVFTAMALVEYAAVHYFYVYEKQLRQISRAHAPYVNKETSIVIDEGECEPGIQDHQSIELKEQTDLNKSWHSSNHVEPTENKPKSAKKQGLLKYIRAFLACPYLLYAVVRRDALIIDQVSRVAFPVVFCLFNCIYWMYYMAISQ